MRPLAIFCAAFAAGCALTQYVLPAAYLPGAALAALLVGLAGFFLHGRRRCVILCALGAAAAFLYSAAYIRVVSAPCEALAGTADTVTMELCDYASQTQYGAKVRVRVLGRGLRGYAVYYGDSALLALEPGEQVTDEVSFHSACDPSGGGERIHTFSAKGVYFLLYSEGEPEYAAGCAGALRYLPQRTARRLGETIERTLDEREAGFLYALLLGDKRYLDEEDSVNLSQAGIYHITAVSGLHCAFLVELLDRVLRPAHRRVRSAAAIPLLLFYAMTVGAPPSVLRACVMLSMIQLAPLFQRESDSPTALSLALLLILLENPYAIASISLQLSFSAVAGLSLLTPRLTQRIRTENRVLRFLLTSAATTLGAMAFSTPLCAWYFGTLSLVSVLSNLLCLWAVSLTFAAGLAGILLAMLLPQAGAAALLPARLGIRYLLAMAGWLEELPLHALYFNTPLAIVWLLYLYALLGVCAAARRGKYRWWAAGALSVLMLLVVVRANALTFDRGELHVTALDVGQGESVAMLSQGHAVLVDCGSSNSYVGAGGIAADYLMSAGVRRLDGVVLTHYHADHANGLAELFARMDVEALYLPDLAEEDSDREAVVSLAGRYGVAVRYVTEETCVALGDASLTVFPPVGAGGANELGLTILCSAGAFDTLITGDMDAKTERELVETYALPDIEVLLVGHHGSRYSTSTELLEATTPEVGIVSVGDNSYGHPTKEALFRLTDAGVSVYRTDLQGNIHITVN